MHETLAARDDVRIDDAKVVARHERFGQGSSSSFWISLSTSSLERQQISAQMTS